MLTIVRTPRIYAIVLAAGSSSRMGRSKALLPCSPEGPTFVARIAGTLREAGIGDVLVVGRADDRVLQEHVQSFSPPGTFVVNPDPARGQLSSLLAGLDAAHDADGVLVWPVDCPLVRAGTLTAILTRAAARGAPLARPVRGGRHGHPVFFHRAVFVDLRSADPEVGARAVVRARAGEVLDVEVNDPGILADIDTPADYDALMEGPS